MKQKLLIALVIIGTAFFGTNPLKAQSTTLAGSWQFNMTPSPGVTEQAIYALATFTTDGSMIETDSTEVTGISPSIRTTVRAGTPGHGIWQPAPVPGNLFIQFISLIVNPNGTLYARRTVTIIGAMDASGNNFTGTYSFTLTNPMGGFVGTGSGTITGERIPHPLLP